MPFISKKIEIEPKLIMEYVKTYNKERSKPFIWSYDPTSIDANSIYELIH